MLHAREDYNRIQDPAGLIPEDEPVFLIRGKDLAASSAIRAWADTAKAYGAKPNIIAAALSQAERVEAYQASAGAKVPDMPDGN